MRRPLLALALAAALAACRGDEPPYVATGAAPGPADTLPPPTAALAAEPVVGRTGPGGAPFSVALRTRGESAHLQRRIGVRTFALPLRTGGLALTQYPCGSCHQGLTVVRRESDAHENIATGHPPEGGGSCTSCHRRDAVDRLALEGGASATLDHAYRLCAQCHSAQVAAWAAGHHGKRLEGWRGVRVVMGCADCHDPHRPEVARRVPFPGPRLPEQGTLVPGSAHEEEERFPLPPGGRP